MLSVEFGFRYDMSGWNSRTCPRKGTPRRSRFRRVFLRAIDEVKQTRETSHSLVHILIWKHSQKKIVTDYDKHLLRRRRRTPEEHFAASMPPSFIYLSISTHFDCFDPILLALSSTASIPQSLNCCQRMRSRPQYAD